MTPNCPFCQLSESRVLKSTAYSLAIRDSFPISEGHTLVVPITHVSSIYELGEEELLDLWALAGKVREDLKASYSPDAFNIGINDGWAAGQTVEHAHVHVIPRWEGDVLDPRGGIRWVIAEKAKYWE